MLDDSSRIITISADGDDSTIDSGTVKHRELKTKEDIKNYVKGLL